MVFAPNLAFKRLALAITAFAAIGGLGSCSQSPDEKVETAVAEALEHVPTKAEFPSLNAEMFQALAADAPALRPHLAELERAEKANQARAANVMRDWAKEREAAEDAGRPQAAFTVDAPVRRSARLDQLGWLVPSAHAQDGDGIVAMISGFTSGLLMADMVGRGSDGKAGSDKRSIDGEKGENVIITQEGKADGTIIVSLESNVDVIPLGLIGGTKSTLSSKSFCPDASGRVEFTIRMEQKASLKGLGALGKQSGTLEANVVLTTNESGEIASTVIKSKYDRQSSGGSGASSASGSADWTTTGDTVELSGPSKGTATGTAGDAHRSSAMASAVAIGMAAAKGASRYWRYGNCVRIEAVPPHRPKPGETTDIPVKVVHKADGTAVGARIDTKLDGGASLSPVVIRRTPGTLTHVVPNAVGAQMKLELDARSRRGGAFERYRFETIDTCYTIEGGGGEFKGSGSTCNLTQPFTVSGNANIVVDFTPTSEKGGTYSYTGEVMGGNLSGKGNYTVQYNAETPVGITGSGPGTACTPMGCFTRPGAEKYTLTPN